MILAPMAPRHAGAPRLLDLDFVTPRLAVGALLPADGAGVLVRELGVRRVVDVRLEARDDEVAIEAGGGALLHLPTEDLRALSPAALARGVGWTLDALGTGHRVLIHCQHGVGRSALLTACVLVAQGLSAAEALRACKAARPCVSPSPEQLEALLAFAASTHLRARARPATFDELAAIAYAGLEGH